jgi:hypothetical protein
MARSNKAGDHGKSRKPAIGAREPAQAVGHGVGCATLRSDLGQPGASGVPQPEAMEPSKSDRSWSWILTGCMMPVAMFVLTWVIKDRRTWGYEEQKVALQRQQVELMRIQDKQAPRTLPATPQRGGAPRLAFAPSPAITEAINQIYLLIRYEKDAQAYRAGSALIRNLPPDARALVSGSFLRAAEQQYEKEKFGNAAHLMKDALRPLTATQAPTKEK